ncbi:hypothetical protein IU501_03525 [Nocardia otitidiscaviarum]|uniref:hypothetical protein n=1 Tax=Nocardia otitidiscaviarum TaxID=1823 RepID=UPI0006935102|nr:hypothetical protein [Nocardia otitidiscaviarum]MBF6132069.1 hypothetical protein [Nocardia otitidiscaviarum]MBF6483199.1 hypothetical protein [Nocardia otitidiscaviarum]
MAEVIRVFTPIKRVPTVIGKAQNGQKIPFGPYTLPQVAAGVALMLVTSIAAMSIPGNPAVVFILGLVLTVIVVFALGLVPDTGVRLTSRVLWFGRLILIRKPVSASGMPVSPDSARYSVYIEDSVVVILPDLDGVPQPEPPARALASGILELAAGRTADPTRDEPRNEQ